jgi:hypothetical protein
MTQSGGVQETQMAIEVRLVARLKSDPAVERQLVDRIVLRNPVLQ